ncbi:MAG: hypothetical protein ABI234_14935 [Ktedonobacteraceae bacterium]
MPKTSMYTLIWLPEQGWYELYAQGQVQPVRVEGETWRVWLAIHTLFAFRGQQGHLTLLKESRARGSEEGYWYAYRSQNGHTRKKYAGRSSELTPIRLEEIARVLAAGKSVAQNTPLEVQAELYVPKKVTAVQSAPMQSMPLLVKNWLSRSILCASRCRVFIASSM